MRDTTKIEIDIDVYRAIEAQRTSFGQTANDILRSMLDFDCAVGEAKPKSTRVRRAVSAKGPYEIELLGDRISASFLIEVYGMCLLKLAELDAHFLENFSDGASRSRRFIAKDPRDLYMQSPRLAKDYAKRLSGPWYFDTNLSERQIQQRLRFACKVAKLEYGTDLVCNFPA